MTTKSILKRHAVQNGGKAMTYKLAPIEPTEEMIQTATSKCDESVDFVSWGEIYKAMLASCQDVESEPFGYFKAEPFGWTDCDENDDGAIALYEQPQPSKVAELEKHNGLLVDALDYIKRICLSARNPTKRMDWIIARCKSAIVGEEWDRDYAPSPKMQTEIEIKELKTELAKEQADKARLIHIIGNLIGDGTKSGWINEVINSLADYDDEFVIKKAQELDNAVIETETLLAEMEVN